jgi:hypothetical protein
MHLLLRPDLTTFTPTMSRCSIFICATSALLMAVPGWAQTSPDVTRPSSVSSSQKTDATRRGAKGPLPDPVLLDGSSQQPEKRPDYGMLGQFEIPGDDNAKQGGKVGGQQGQPQGGQSSGGAQDAAAAQGGGGGSSGASGQGGGGAAGATAQGAGGAGGAQSPGGQQGNPGGLAGAGMPIQNDPNAKAEGVQVAGLTGDPNDSGGGQAGGAGGAGGGDVQKPQQVALGDPSMRIKPAANAPGAIGASPGVSGGNTMQMESKMSSVGGGGSKDGKNSAEKGRVIPAGL